MTALPIGSTIGILGGGQLGRMLALAAAPLGFRCHIFCPDPQSPAFDVAAETTVAAYDDRDALVAFADAVDVVTFEFENVPVGPLEAIAPKCRPGLAALSAAQDRLAEKTLLSSYADVVPHAAVDDAAGLAPAFEALSAAHRAGEWILKTRTLGYDGKGQARVDPADPAAAFEAIGHAPAIFEKRVSLAGEFSTILARRADGASVLYEPPLNRHEGGILRTSTLPSGLPPALIERAADATRELAAALDYVGVLTVEWFVTEDGALYANEMAPRVHNSGHWTMDAAEVSQFENHMRAIAGWPLGRPDRLAPVVMENIIGADGGAFIPGLGEPGVHLHLYGKREARPGRKMGHINRVARGDFPSARVVDSPAQR